MKKGIIISGNLAQDHEFIYPYYRLLEEEYEIDVCLLEGVPVKGILGTAWDLFHARMSCNRPQLSEMVGQNVYPIFVTKDLGLFELMAPHVEHLIRYDSTKMTITTENNYPPHYSKSFMDYLNEKMLRIGIERVGIERTYDSDKMNKLIKELEENLT